MAKNYYKKDKEVEMNENIEEKSDGEKVKKVFDEIKTEKINKQITESFIEKKIKNIEDSRMPEYQKKEYIKALMPEVKQEGVSFGVYAKLKGIDVTNTEAMRLYPKAVKTKLASLEQWNKIFTDF